MVKSNVVVREIRREISRIECIRQDRRTLEQAESLKVLQTKLEALLAARVAQQDADAKEIAPVSLAKPMSDEKIVAAALALNPDDLANSVMLEQAAQAQERLDATAAQCAKAEAAIKEVEAAIEARRQAEYQAAAVEAAREVSKIVEDLTVCLQDGDRVGADKAIKALQEDDLYDGVIEHFGSKQAWGNFLELRRQELRQLFRRPMPRRRWHK